MEWMAFVFIGFVVIAWIGHYREGQARKKRIKQAYGGYKPTQNIHGYRKFASKRDLKKAGLI